MNVASHIYRANSPAFVVAYQACQWVGAITVSVNVMLTRTVILCDGSIPGTHELGMFGRGAAAPPMTCSNQDDEAAILYTSGTTGKQKFASIRYGLGVADPVKGEQPAGAR